MPGTRPACTTRTPWLGTESEKGRSARYWMSAGVAFRNQSYCFCAGSQTLLVGDLL